MQLYFALADGAARFTQGFTGPALLRILLRPVHLHLQGFHLLWRCFPGSFDSTFQPLMRSPTTPNDASTARFGPIPVRSPLLGKSLLFLVPLPTEMFQFGRFASTPKDGYPDRSGWVSPFGYPWINASLQLPMAFRSLARPSSPLHA
jgi:hypothetical protein